MKKRLFILLAVLTVLSVLAVFGYRYYIKSVSSPLPPVIRFDEELLKVKTNASDAELLLGVTASDPEDGDVTDSLMVEGMSGIDRFNNVKVSYVAFDSKNHMVRADRTVKLTDYKAPKFSLAAPLSFRLSSSINLLENVSAKDMIDGDISGKIKYSIVDDSLSLSSVGEHEIELRVTNSLGLTTRLRVPVEIYQTNPNPVNIELSDYLVYLKKGAEFHAEDYVLGYTLNGQKVEGSSGISATDSVDTEKSGVYSVFYTYGTYSTTTPSHTRLIVVVE